MIKLGLRDKIEIIAALHLLQEGSIGCSNELAFRRARRALWEVQSGLEKVLAQERAALEKAKAAKRRVQ